MRKHFRLLITVAFTLLSLSAKADESFSIKGWDKAYSRRNYQLGMTLPNFRQTKFPDSEQNKKGEVKPEDIHVMCTGDEGANSTQFTDLVFDAADAGAETITCMHFFNDGYGSAFPARMRMGNDWSFPTKFYFIKPDGQEAYYLFKIISRPDDYSFYAWQKGLTVTLKQSPAMRHEQLRNGFGVPYRNDIATWDNGTSRIVLERYDYSLEVGKVTYTLKPLDKIYQQRKKAASAIKPGSV